MVSQFFVNGTGSAERTYAKTHAQPSDLQSSRMNGSEIGESLGYNNESAGEAADLKLISPARERANRS